MIRRQGAVALALAVVLVTGGCAFVLGDEPLSFEASPATPSDAALADTGYEETDVSEQSITQPFTVAGQTREVRVTNHVAQYDRSIDLGPLGSQRAATFAVFSSPEVSVLDRQFNPLAEMSTRELLDQFSSGYEGLDVGDRVGSRNVTMLGEETRMDRYEGTATFDGTQIDVYIHVTEPVNDEGDWVVALAVYPQVLSDERANVRTLVEDLEHEGDG